MKSFLLSKQYLTSDNGKFYATDKLKNYLYTSRIKLFNHKYEKPPKENETISQNESYIQKNFDEVKS